MRIQIKKSYVFAIVFLIIITFVFSVYQYFEALKANSASAVTVGTPNPGHTWSSMQCSADSLCVDTVNNRLGIGTNTPGVKLEVGANTAIKIGNAYLSSGGDYVHLANNEWYNGSAWTATAAGTMYQQSGQANNWYTHDASGGHTVRMQLDPTGNLTLNTGGLSIAGSMTGGTVPWARLGSFPSACSSGQYVSAVGGTLTCSTPPTNTGPQGPQGPTGATGPAGPLQSGMIAMFTTACPSGWTRFTALDGRVPQGSATYGGTGGSNTNTPSVTMGQVASSVGHPNNFPAVTSVGAVSVWPPYLEVIWCQKN